MSTHDALAFSTVQTKRHLVRFSPLHFWRSWRETSQMSGTTPEREWLLAIGSILPPSRFRRTRFLRQTSLWSTTSKTSRATAAAQRSTSASTKAAAIASFPTPPSSWTICGHTPRTSHLCADTRAVERDFRSAPTSFNICMRCTRSYVPSFARYATNRSQKGITAMFTRNLVAKGDSSKNDYSEN